MVLAAWQSVVAQARLGLSLIQSFRLVDRHLPTIDLSPNMRVHVIYHYSSRPRHFATDHSAGLLKRKNIAYWSIPAEEHYGILHFMATRFMEVLPNRGVDDNVGPIPEMIVPLRGTNHILLIDGEGLAVQAEKPHILEITEVKNFVRKDLPKPRMFQLRGRALPGEGGLVVCARRGTTVTATLRVFVLDNRIVRLAVRPLQTAPGVFHAKVLPDPVAFVYEMNEIWAPQANVLIDLVPSKPALIDDPDQNARDMGAFEADGVTPDTKQGVFQESIRMLTQGNFRSFAPVFLSYLGKDPVKNTDFTLFVVHAIGAYAGTTGLTDTSYQFALVSEAAPARTWAHELGHFLRRAHGESTVKGELMVSGGEGEKIPVQDAVKVFNRLHSHT
jgi:hypothetical protein